jgi:hypothetical protein
VNLGSSWEIQRERERATTFTHSSYYRSKREFLLPLSPLLAQEREREGHTDVVVVGCAPTVVVVGLVASYCKYSLFYI